LDWGSYLKPEGELILKIKIKCRDPEGFLNRALSRGLEFREYNKNPFRFAGQVGLFTI